MVDLKYIIFDLEFNQSCNKEDKVLQLPFEKIQIGALKLDENFKTISTFNKLIKPIPLYLNLFKIGSVLKVRIYLKQSLKQL